MKLTESLRSLNNRECCVQESDVFVPGWGENKGMNDRFALMRPSVALQWTGRLKHALRQCLKEPIHSETFASRFAAALNLTVRCPVLQRCIISFSSREVFISESIP